jgi:hypothetical protein
MVPGPPNFGGLRPKGLIFSPNLGPPEQTCMVDPPNLAPFGPCLIPNSPNAGGLTCPLGKFYTIFLKHFGDVHKILQIIFCLRGCSQLHLTNYLIPYKINFLLLFRPFWQVKCNCHKFTCSHLFTLTHRLAITV